MTKKSLTSEMDRSVKRMLKLIEEEGDSFAKKAEMYYRKRPELISHVEDFYRMYRSLAERYDHLTGELRKNIPLDLQSQASNVSNGGTDLGSPLPSVERNLSRRRSSHRAAGFDFFLGSTGGSSDLSLKESGDSSPSSSSSSDSESESVYSTPAAFADGDGIRKKIIELEVELRDVKEKLRIAEEEKTNAFPKVEENYSHENLHVRMSLHEEELKSKNESIRLLKDDALSLKLNFEDNVHAEGSHDWQAQLESSQKELESREEELKFERTRVLELQERISGFENVIDINDKIDALEKELSLTKEKLKVSEDEIVRLELGKCQVDDLKTDNVNRDHKFASEEEIARLTLELENKDAYVGLEYQHETCQKDITRLEAAVELEKKQVSELQEQICTLEVEISGRNHEIRDLKEKISEASTKFSFEKSQLQIVITGLSESRALLETKLNEWESRGYTLEENVKSVETEKAELLHRNVTRELGMQSEIDQLKADIDDRSNCIEKLNKEFDAHKMKYDMLMTERDGLNAKILTLISQLSSRDDQIHQMNEHLNQLHIEHVQLISGSELGRKMMEDAHSRLKDLEKEVEEQKVTISNAAEEKREAIRQLCFSLDHYRNGYQQLRQAFLVYRRPAVLV
ncbi:hypothetical protein GIB67_041076 [Kingdonia uniflora]|uniref:NAB domain-containing protein n=1 Tax=Kingdonia uniflora TaxID=39325 RepID=A0A7J7LKF7_9MAGN|nr:hypothetical protein GIB67_041076 [Kingdonia uniflora]